MPSHKKISTTSDLSSVLNDVQKEISLARTEYRKNNKVRYMLSLAFLRGVFSAIGAMIALAIVIPMIVLVLRSIAWPSIISGFISTILTQIEQTNRQLPQGTADQ